MFHYYVKIYYGTKWRRGGGGGGEGETAIYFNSDKQYEGKWNIKLCN